MNRWPIVVATALGAFFAMACGSNSGLSNARPASSHESDSSFGSLDKLLPTLNITQVNVDNSFTRVATPVAPLRLVTENLTPQEFALQHPQVVAPDPQTALALLTTFHATRISTAFDSGNQIDSNLVLFDKAGDADQFVTAIEKQQSGKWIEYIDMPPGVSRRINSGYSTGFQVLRIGRIVALTANGGDISYTPMITRIVAAQGGAQAVGSNPFVETTQTFTMDYGNLTGAKLTLKFGKTTFQLSGGACVDNSRLECHGDCVVGFGSPSSGLLSTLNTTSDSGPGVSIDWLQDGVQYRLVNTVSVAFAHTPPPPRGTFAGTSDQGHVQFSGTFQCDQGQS